jgi:hypothetical protein
MHGYLRQQAGPARAPPASYRCGGENASGDSPSLLTEPLVPSGVALFTEGDHAHAHSPHRVVGDAPERGRPRRPEVPNDSLVFKRYAALMPHGENPFDMVVRWLQRLH